MHLKVHYHHRRRIHCLRISTFFRFPWNNDQYYTERKLSHSKRRYRNADLDYNAEPISKKTIKDGINSNKTFHLVAKNPAGKSIELRSDQLLLDVGRVPNSDTLGLEASGVKTNKKSFIITYGYLETNVKGIFALGDAIGHYLFNIMQTMRHSMLIIISCIPMTRSLSAMPQCHMQFLALLKSPE
jgi:thioredoxin reductase